MTIAFDLDGTLDVPAIAAVFDALRVAGIDTIVLTGAIEDSGEWTMASREAKCAALGLVEPRIVRAFGTNIKEIAVEKARICKEVGVSLMFEDSLVYASEIAKSGTCCVCVVPGE